jgi:hypothetical protein
MVIGDIELLGGGVPSASPACAGAMFRLLPGYDPGAPQPTSDYVVNLLDGERNVGRRAGDRTVKLPVWIIATDRDNLAAAREHLESAVDAELFTLTWARDRGPGLPPLPLLLDCFRALPTNPVADLIWEKRFCQKVELTIPAMPYGRSDVQERLAFASPVPAGPPPPPPPVVIDNYETITSALCYQHTAHIVGPHSCCWDPDDPRVGDPGGSNSMFTYTNVLAGSLDLTSMTGLSVYLGFGSRWYHCLPFHGRQDGVAVEITLTDTSENTLEFSRSHLRLPVSASYQLPTFTRVTMRIPQGDPVFQYASLAGYTLKVSNHHWAGQHHLRWVTLYVDALTAYPDTQTTTPSPKGAVYLIRAPAGTARSAMSLQFQQPPAASTATTLTTAGVGNYTVPVGTSWVKAEGTGAGGAGAGRTTAGMGGGGGGGEYAREDVFPGTDLQVIPYSVGAGGTDGTTPADGMDTLFGPGPASSMVLTAHGGDSAQSNSAAGALGGTGSVNTVHHDGGKGRDATGSFGGGGGSSGGTSNPGLTPAGTSSNSWTTPGTTLWTCPPGVFQVYAETWGSGGGAATGYSSGNGGGGGGGEYAAGWVPTTPGNSYNVVVAAVGAGASGGPQRAGSDGASSSFTGDGGAQVLAHGGKAGTPTNSGSTGGGAGGTGSSALVHHDGGKGGSSNPYAGGGGSSASPSGDGNPGDGYAHAGSAPTDGGAGGAGSGANSNPGTSGSIPGGGGGGTYNNSTAGSGAAGKVRLTYPGGSPDQYGAPAVTGGGAGGNGGATANSPGSAGSLPGGGGGGADSAGSTVTGGPGGGGRLIITPYSSPTWKSLIAHRPPRGASKYYQPLIPAGAGADTPDGTHWYAPPQPVSGVNALFSGTYTVLLVASSWNGSGSRTVTVTARQTEYPGGPTYTAPTPGVTFTPSQVVNGLLAAGVLTLPVRDLPPDNTAASFAFSVNDTNTADRFYDLILLDTMGQTVIINNPSTGYLRYWIDAPDANAAIGRILGSQSDRSAAVMTLVNDGDRLSGGPLTIEPGDGDNLLFAYSPDALAPAIGVTYFPAWYFDRTS